MTTSRFAGDALVSDPLWRAPIAKDVDLDNCVSGGQLHDSACSTDATRRYIASRIPKMVRGCSVTHTLPQRLSSLGTVLVVPLLALALVSGGSHSR